MQCNAANYILLYSNYILLYSNYILDNSLVFRVTVPDAASIQFNLLMMSIKCSKNVEDYNKRIVK